MKTEDHIDELIRREKETIPNPYLSSRVMAKIEGLEKCGEKKNPLPADPCTWSRLCCCHFSGSFNWKQLCGEQDT